MIFALLGLKIIMVEIRIDLNIYESSISINTLFSGLSRNASMKIKVANCISHLK